MQRPRQNRTMQSINGDEHRRPVEMTFSAEEGEHDDAIRRNEGCLSTSPDPSGRKASRPSSVDDYDGLSYRAVVAMALLAIQFGVQPILTEKFISNKIVKSTVILTQEVVKMVLAVIGISRGSAGWGEITAGWTVPSWLRLSLLPATIYLVQNMCALLAYQNLSATTYNVLNQTKTLSAALCCYLLMKKKQSPMQMLAIFLLLVAALITERMLPITDMLSPSYWANDDIGTGVERSSRAMLSPRHFSHGVLPILTASFLSGLAGAICQKSLQVHDRDSLLFTLELCVASILILLISLVVSEDGKNISKRGFFHEWTPLTFVPILSNSAGGIVVGLVTKYAGTVRKGFSLVFGILLSGIFQSALDERNVLSREEIAGGVLAAVSLWMHVTNNHSSQSGQKSQKRDGRCLRFRKGRIITILVLIFGIHCLVFRIRVRQLWSVNEDIAHKNLNLSSQEPSLSLG